MIIVTIIFITTLTCLKACRRRRGWQPGRRGRQSCRCPALHPLSHPHTFMSNNPGEPGHPHHHVVPVLQGHVPTLRSFTWGNIRVFSRTEPQGSRQSPLISFPSWPLLLLVSLPSSLRLCWHHLHTDYVPTPNLCPVPASGTQTKMPVFPTVAA